MSVAWYWPDWDASNACSDPPEESCSDAACPVHGWDGDDRDIDYDEEDDQ